VKLQVPPAVRVPESKPALVEVTVWLTSPSWVQVIVWPTRTWIGVGVKETSTTDAATGPGAGAGAVGWGWEGAGVGVGPGTVLGMEFAGTVEAAGAEAAAAGFAAGDRVMGSGRGAFAEFAVSDISRVTRIPDGLDFDHAATFPVALQTMHDAIVTHGALRRGQSVLIQGASSGVGIMGMQIAKFMGAGLVISTSTNAERRARLTEDTVFEMVILKVGDAVTHVVLATEKRFFPDRFTVPDYARDPFDMSRQFADQNFRPDGTLTQLGMRQV